MLTTPEVTNESREIIVRSFKYDGREHRRWRARIISQEAALVVLYAEFEEEIRHPLLGTLERGTRSVEYYWLDRWYNIFRFLDPAGGLRNFYCNINIPPVIVGDLLSYVDLDVDVLVAPDLSYKVLDEDEFAANALRFNYPRQVLTRSTLALNELVALIETAQFPFDQLT